MGQNKESQGENGDRISFFLQRKGDRDGRDPGGVMTNKLFLVWIIGLLLGGSHVYGKVIRVGVYGTYGVSEIIDVLNNQDGMKAKEVPTLGVDKKTLQHYDTLIFCAPRVTPPKALITSYIKNGYGGLDLYRGIGWSWNQDKNLINITTM